MISRPRRELILPSSVRRRQGGFISAAPVPSPGEPGGGDSDFALRGSGPNVVFIHDFDSADEVDQFRWCSGYSGGNDPDDAGTSRAQNSVEHVASGGIDDGGFLRLTRYSGSSESKDWWRPLSPMNASSNGRGVADPALSGNLTLRSFSPTDGGSQTASWSNGNYGPVTESSSYDGRMYCFQVAMRLDSRRADGVSVTGGKIMYFTRTNQSLTAQELVPYYKGSGEDFAIYRAGSPEIPNDLEAVPHIFDQWGTYLFRVVAGDEESATCQVEVWRMMDDETEYTKIFQKLDAYVDYQNAYTKAWNAWIASTYHNGISLPEFTQEYDKLIFSHDWIVEPGTWSSPLYAACAELDVGEHAEFTPDGYSSLSLLQIEWQMECYHDPMHHLIHLLGKQANNNTGWSHTYYNIIDDEWTTVAGNFMGASYAGHIYGNSGMDYLTGRLYAQPGNSNSQSNRNIRMWDPETGVWTTEVEEFDDEGAWNSIPNGLAVHPQLFGPNEPGVVVDQQISTSYIKLSDDTHYRDSHSSNAFGQKEGGGIYWPYMNACIMGGATGDAICMVVPNDGDEPTRTTLSDPPITLSGQSRGSDGDLNAGFGSIHVHPRDPAKLLIVETAGPRAWVGSWTGSDVSWSAIDNHPFENPGHTPRVVCSMRDTGCMLAIGRSLTYGEFMYLWKPPTS